LSGDSGRPGTHTYVEPRKIRDPQTQDRRLHVSKYGGNPAKEVGKAHSFACIVTVENSRSGQGRHTHLRSCSEKCKKVCV